MHRHNSSTFPSVDIVGSSLSLFLNLTLSYLCLLIIIWVCDVLFFWKIYFCRFVLSTFLIFNFFFLLPFVNGEFIHFSTPKTHLFPTWLQNPHLYSVHENSDLHILNVPRRVAKSWKWLKRLSTHTCMILSRVTGRNQKLGVSEVPRRRWRADSVKQMIYFILFRTGIRHGGTNSSSSKWEIHHQFFFHFGIHHYKILCICIRRILLFKWTVDILVLMSQNLHSPNLFKMDYPFSCSHYLKLFIGFYMLFPLFEWLHCLLTIRKINRQY